MIKFMVLDYNSYILKSTVSDLRGRRIFSEPGSQNDLCESLLFTYVINISLSELKNQADLFADNIISKFGYSKRANVKRYTPENRETISRAYQYSYFKCIWYSYCFTLFETSCTSVNSYCFGGHKQIYDCIKQRYIYDYDRTFNTETVRYLTIEDSTINGLFGSKDQKGNYIKETGSSLWSSCCKDTFKGPFFDKECEFTLDYLRRSYPELDLVKLDDPQRFSSGKNPLGNCVWSSELDSLLYLPVKEMYVDYKSMFWGKACFITIKDEPVIDSDDRFYRSNTDFDNRPDRIRGFDIESVTGVNPFIDLSNRPMSDLNDDPNSRSRNTPNIRGGSGGSGGNSNNSNNNNNNNSGNNSNSRNNDNKNDKNSDDQNDDSNLNSDEDDNFEPPSGKYNEFGMLERPINGRVIKVKGLPEFKRVAGRNILGQIKTKFYTMNDGLQRFIENAGREAGSALNSDAGQQVVKTLLDIIKDKVISENQLKSIEYRTGVPIPYDELERTYSIGFGNNKIEQRRVTYNQNKNSKDN